MSKRIRVHIGTRQDMGQRFVDAWRRLEAGQGVSERYLTCSDRSSLFDVLRRAGVELPDHASFDAHGLRESIERGLADSNAGWVIEVEELMKELGINE